MKRFMFMLLVLVLCGGQNCSNSGNGPSDDNSDDNGNDSSDVLCMDTCDWAGDGVCDDGGPDAEYDVCAYGTDCADCGPREDESGDDGTESEGNPIDLAEGKVLVSDGGVTIEVQPNSGYGTFRVIELVTSEKEKIGQRDEDGYFVSPVYDIRTEGFERGMLTIPIKVSLVVDLNPMDPPIDEHLFYVETYDETTGEWVDVDSGYAPDYDEEAQTVSFLTTHFSKYRVRDAGLVHESEWGFLDIYSNSQLIKYVYTTEYCDIVYYLDAAFGQDSRHAVPTDAIWQPVGSGSYSDPEVPDYIEDVARAIKDTYEYLAALKASGGAKVFGRPGKFTCHVVGFKKSTRGNAGGDYSFVTGNIRIVPGLAKWSTDMQTTVGHEMAHLFCDHGYYTVAGAMANEWFFEAIANLYAARAFGLDAGQTAACFGELLSPQYLGGPLNAADEGSMYAAADFLMWLEQKTSRPLAADALKADKADDLEALRSVTPSSMSFNDLYTEYVREVFVGNNVLRSNAQPIVLEITNTNPGWEYASSRAHLSAELVMARGQMSVDGLLVVAPVDALNSAMQSFSYATASIQQNTVSDVQAYMEKQVAAGRPVTVPHFGKQGTPGVTSSLFLQVIANRNTSPEYVSMSEHQVAPAAVTFKYMYYLLQPPVVDTHASSAGSVTWSYTIPDLKVWDTRTTDTSSYIEGDWLIKGFNVYENGVKLNTDLVGPTQRSYSPVSKPCSVVVTVVDLYGNEWPQAAGISVPCQEGTGTWTLAERKVIRNDWESGSEVANEYTFTCQEKSASSFFTSIVEKGHEDSSFMKATHAWSGLGAATLTPGQSIEITLSNTDVTSQLYQSNVVPQTIFQSADLVLTQTASGQTSTTFSLVVPEYPGEDLVFKIFVQDDGVLWGFGSGSHNMAEIQYRYSYSP